MGLIGIGISILNLLKKAVVVDESFTFTVKTDNTGTSNNDQFTLPLSASFNGITANVDWGDGNNDTITAYNQSEVTHTYSAAGTYTIIITNAIRSFRFNGGGDRLKITNVSNWGVFELNQSQSFRSCANMIITATDAPTVSTNDFYRMFFGCTALTGNISTWDVSGVTSFRDTFRDCTVFNSPLGTWDVSGCFNFAQMFHGSNSFNQPLESWDTSSATSLNQMFRDASAFNQSLNSWDVSSVTSFYGVFRNADSYDQNLGSWDLSSGTVISDFLRDATGLSTTNYNSTLIGWANTGVPSGLTCNFGGSKYTAGGTAEAARNTLINTYNWTIIDGGTA